MLTISAPLSAAQVSTYHAERWRSTAENYYSAGGIASAWAGALAERFGLSGDVTDTDFQRLAAGQHPDGSTLIAHRQGTAYTTAAGKTVTPMEHRAGWDATFSAPKSVSLVALVGGDDRLRQAHRESVAVALTDLEQYAQARLGGTKPAETTGKLLIATFDHDSARPVEGYAAPQLHTHAVILNMTAGADGQIRSVQSRSLYEGQALATAVYRTELARRLTELGYQVRREQTSAGDVPEIAGLSADYLAASSPRRAQILAALAVDGRTGAAAAQIAAHQTRDAKQHAPEEMRATHQAIAASFGDQPSRAVSLAQQHGPRTTPEPPGLAAAAVTFAVDRNIERDAVVDERAIRRDALVRAMGLVPTQRITDEVTARVKDGRLLERPQGPGAPATAFTTPEMVALEQATIDTMIAGHGQHQPLADPGTIAAIVSTHQQLYTGQRAAVIQVLESPDTVTALHGIAGAGKTTTLTAIAEAATLSGYRVQGLAPTARAADQLATATGSAQTLQRHLTESPHIDPLLNTLPATLFVLDEASLASTVQMHAFLERLTPHDRVLLVGDARQHESVEAGRTFVQLQAAGLRTAHLDDIVRQPNPEHRQVVEQLARGEIPTALAALTTQHRVHEVRNQEARLAAVARAYAAAPTSTIVVSPDNDSRARLNAAIHREMRVAGVVREKEHQTPVLVARQDMTGPDRGWADRYEVGNVVRYSKGSTTFGFEPGDYATVTGADARANTLTVRSAAGASITYNPARLKGVTVYREADRVFAVGDRVQFTQPYKAQRVRNRDLGTVAAVSPSTMRVKLDTGRSVGFAFTDYRHLDSGYAVTSYSSQGLTADRVILHIDTDRGGGDQRTAYVSLSRARHDAQIYTNDISRMTHTLSRDRSHRQAI